MTSLKCDDGYPAQVLPYHPLCPTMVNRMRCTVSCNCSHLYLPTHLEIGSEGTDHVLYTTVYDTHHAQKDLVSG